MPTQTPILGLYNPLDADDANTAVRVWRTADNAVLDAAVGTARQNQLTNPGMEVWQRGPGPFTTAGAYTADRWLVGVSVSTYSLTRIASTIGTLGFSAQIAYTHGASGFLSLYQAQEGYPQLRARTVEFAASVKSTVAGTVRVWVWDNLTGYTYSAFNATTGEERLTLSVAIAAGAVSVSVGVDVRTASCVVEVNDATLCVGATPLGYALLHAAEDVQRCLRYYELHGGIASGMPSYFGYQAAGQSVGVSVPFAVRKGGVPTVTRVGTWSVTNCAQPSVVEIGRASCRERV